MTWALSSAWRQPQKVGSQSHAIGNSANRRSRSVGRARRASSWRTIVDRPLSSIWQSQQAVIHGLRGLWGKVKEGQCIEEEKRSVAHARHASMPHFSRFPPGKLCRRPLFAIAASACSSVVTDGRVGLNWRACPDDDAIKSELEDIMSTVKSAHCEPSICDHRDWRRRRRLQWRSSCAEPEGKLLLGSLTILPH